MPENRIFRPIAEKILCPKSRWFPVCMLFWTVVVGLALQFSLVFPAIALEVVTAPLLTSIDGGSAQKGNHALKIAVNDAKHSWTNSLRAIIGLDSLPNVTVEYLQCVAGSRGDLPILRYVVGTRHAPHSSVSMALAFKELSAIAQQYSDVPYLTAAVELLAESGVALGVNRIDRGNFSSLPQDPLQVDCERVVDLDVHGMYMVEGGDGVFPRSPEMMDLGEYRTTMLGAPYRRGRDSIVRLVHQTWATADPFASPDRFHGAARTWMRKNGPNGEPAWPRVLWGNAAHRAVVQLVQGSIEWYDALIRDPAAPFPHETAFDYLPQVVETYDVTRLALLCATGGVYADFDVARRSVSKWDSLFQENFVVAAPDDPFLTNDVFLSTPGHPLITRLLQKALVHSFLTIPAIPFSREYAVLFGSGPIFTTFQVWTTHIACSPYAPFRPKSCTSIRILKHRGEYIGKGAFFGHVQGATWIRKGSWIREIHNILEYLQIEVPIMVAYFVLLAATQFFILALITEESFRFILKRLAHRIRFSRPHSV